MGAARDERNIYKQKNKGENKAEFWSEIVQIRGQWNVTSTKNKKNDVRNLYPVKISFKDKSKILFSLDKEKLKGFFVLDLFYKKC